MNADWPNKEIGLDMKFALNIKESMIDVSCEVNRWKDEDHTHVWMRALDLARAAVNVAAFASGLGLSVLLDTLILPDGSASTIRPIDPRLESLCTAYRINDPAANSAFEQVWTMVASNPSLFMIFDDLIRAISLPHEAPINCGRALDGIRSIMAPGRKTAGWEVVRDNLKCSEDHLKFVTEHSKGPRHGDRTFIPGDITVEIVARAWKVTNRFLEFKKRGDQPLPESEFPILK
jgi:hypothetical protein